jgi:hypothetical protein
MTEPSTPGEASAPTDAAEQPPEVTTASTAKRELRVRRIARWAAVAVVVFIGLSIGLVVWSIGEHEQLMLEQQEATSGISRTPLFTPDMLDGKYVYYRAPAIVATNAGALLVFAEGRDGSKGDRGHTEIVHRRSDDSGKSWSEPKVILAKQDFVTGNPTLLIDRETNKLSSFEAEEPLGMSVRGHDRAVTARDEHRVRDRTKPGGVLVRHALPLHCSALALRCLLGQESSRAGPRVRPSSSLRERKFGRVPEIQGWFPRPGNQ